MLQLRDPSNGDNKYEFSLNVAFFSGNKNSYVLNCSSLGNAHDFTFDVFVASNKIYPDITASVFFYKNLHFLSKDIIGLNLRVNNSTETAGYFFKLTSIFQNGTLSIPKHIFTAINAGLITLFNNIDCFQTKFPEIGRTSYDITDFFEDDIIILILCDQIILKVPGFNLKHYLADLYLYGFVNRKLDAIDYINSSSYVKDNYNNLADSVGADGVYSLTPKAISSSLQSSDYVFTLFENLIFQKHDDLTRFFLLYQIVEILIDKVFKVKIQEVVCNNLPSLTSYDLRNKLPEVGKEGERIKWLFNSEFSNISPQLNSMLVQSFCDFFVTTSDPDFPISKTFTLAELFYGYRNKLVHNYRYLHENAFDASVIKTKMDKINQGTEMLISEIIISYKK